MVTAAVAQDTNTTVADAFLDCLARARHETKPYDHWLLTEALPQSDVDAIGQLPLPPPSEPVFNGKRETNNSTRIYFTPENQERYPVVRRVVEGFQDRRVRDTIARTTGADLSDGNLRIEYCQDQPGFWLEPHTDIFVKRFTMLVYLLDDPALVNAGTDVLEGPPDYKYVHSAPHARNRGVIFIPGPNTWHGVGHHPLTKLRKSIIINYVTSQWRDKWELA
jgi:hypothetical protein